MFHNVLMTTLTPLSNINEIDCWENRPFTNVSPDKNEQRLYDTNITRTIKKKNKRIRTSYTTEQLRVLERTFSRTKYIDRERRRELSEVLGLGEKCVKVWFQNRRMKEKKDNSESSGDSSSEGHADSVSLSTSAHTEDFKTQKAQCPTNYLNAEHTMKSYYFSKDYEQKILEQNQFLHFQEMNRQHFNNSQYIHYSFQNDTNVYPTQYYPNIQNECNFMSPPYNQYYNSETQLCSEGNFPLKYL
ncbi:unnamed protein product [Parnassius mnemosyne]|uniref:Homeobox domain-containing protein n=1 Tax=Parnassius mnemosyne TaxID=213953 RepID=A0AAV1KA91_9NEOP